MININFQQVDRLGDTLKSLEMSAGFQEFMTPSINAEKEVQLLAFFWPSVICHSTKGGLKGKYQGKAFNGWDYLLRSFCMGAEQDPETISVISMQQMTAKKLMNLLTKYATDHKIGLKDLDRRADLLVESAGELLALFGGSVSQLLDAAGHRVGGNHGAYALLERFSVFKDELKKKSTAFLMTVHFSNLWNINDPEHVFPMIDYHRMRVFCRTGCIEISDPAIRMALIARTTVDPSVEAELRSLSFDICKYLIGYTGIPLFDFDALIWAHARSCCRNHPICVSGQIEDDSFYDYLKKDYQGFCEYSAWCKGYTDSQYYNIWEPVITTENY